MKIRWFSEPLIGPLASWELVRLARRGHAHRARLLVLYLLFLALIATPFLWFGDVAARDLLSFEKLTVPRNSKVSLGQAMALGIWEAVLLGVAVMMPGIATIALAEEKERDTLQMLLTTALSDREIVLGKAAGRLGFVLASAAGALPLISACAIFDFIDIRFMAAGAMLTCSTATLCAAIGVQAACTTRDLRTALIQAYGMTALALIGVIVGPFVVMYLILKALNSTGTFVGLAIGYPLLQLAVAVAFFRSAIQQIRCDERDPPPIEEKPRLSPNERWLLQIQGPKKIRNQSRPEEAFLLLPYESQLERIRTLKKMRRHRSPPRAKKIYEPSEPKAPLPAPPPAPPRPSVSESNPLLWKERYISGRNTGTGEYGRPLPLTLILASMAILIIVLGFTILVADAMNKKPSIVDGAHLVLVGGTLAGGVYLVPCAIGLAAAIARERHQKTLDTLLSLPIDRQSILRTKVGAVLERTWWLIPVAIVGPAAAFVVDRDWRLGLASAGFVLAGMTLVIGLGSLLSVRCPTEMRALRLLAPVVVIVLGVPVAVWNGGNAISFNWTLFDLIGFAVLATVAGLISWFRASRLLDRLE
jgi:ABC-type Na+ efflux pump permease subunit